MMQPPDFHEPLVMPAVMDASLPYVAQVQPPQAVVVAAKYRPVPLYREPLPQLGAGPSCVYPRLAAGFIGVLEHRHLVRKWLGQRAVVPGKVCFIARESFLFRFHFIEAVVPVQEDQIECICRK